MAFPRGTEHSGKSLPPFPPSEKVRRGTEYLARVISLEEIFGFVRSYGPGDHVVAWVASGQLGVITARQLGAAGIGKDGIALRWRRGSLHRVHKGVYLVGHTVMLPGAIEFAAVLACQPEAFVSHRSAAALWGLADPPATPQLTVVRRACSRAGICAYRVARLDAQDRRFARGIPITSPARTLLDFASGAGSEELERAIGEVRARKLANDHEIWSAVGRAPGRAGVAALKAQLRREGGPQWTQSEAERQMLKLIRAAGLPAPRTQVRVAGWPADFLWPEHRLIVEFDGYRFHGHRAAFERGRRRDQAHIAAGYTVVRVTWRQLTEEPLAVVAAIARPLGRDPR